MDDGGWKPRGKKFGSSVMPVDGFKIQDFKLWEHGTLLYADSKSHLAKWLRIHFALAVSP